MKIAIDATELEGRPTGVGRYLANLMRTWLSEDGPERFTLFHCGEPAPLPWMEDKRVTLRQLPHGTFKNLTWWRQRVLPVALQHEKPDVLFCPSYEIPLAWKGPTVVTIHDLSFAAFPQWFGFPEGFRRRFLTRRSAKKATIVIAVSDFTRDEIIMRYQVEAGKVRVVYHGVGEEVLNEAFTPEDELRERFSLDGHVALMVGSIFERRFPEQAIKAFALIGDLKITLVIAGEDRRLRKTRSIEKMIEDAGVKDRVRWLGYCSDKDLNGLYRFSSLVIALSLYEGFSLPPLEALLFRVPSIVSDRSAQAEVYGEVAVTISEENDRFIAAAVRSLATNQTIRDELLIRGEEMVSKFTLARCAAQTKAILKAAAS